MLDPRIYRMSLLLPALALVVLAFSLSGQPRALRASLPPAAFNGASVAGMITSLQKSDPVRTAGSTGDRNVATEVRGKLGAKGSGFAVSTDDFEARTPAGERQLENVVATRAGTSSNGGSIVVVAPRDGPGIAGLSGTATLLELGHALGGETLQRTVVLASISGSRGAAGAARLAARLPGPVDAVIVLGDLASRARHAPIVIPWSTDGAIAPVRLRNTLTAALQQQAGIHAGMPDLLNQLAHLAFPLTISQQGPFGARGVPAVQLSFSGERGPVAGAATDHGAARMTAVGRGVLSAVSALGAGPAVAAPSAYVVFDQEVVPSWAVSLFVLALIIPVALTTIDGVARARRRRYRVGRALGAVLVAACPFLVAGLVVLIGRSLGAITPLSGATGPGVITADGSAIAVLAIAAAVAVGFGVLARMALRAAARVPEARPARGRDARAGVGAIPAPKSVVAPEDGTAAAMLLVLCVAAVLLWAANPFAAALLVPALHLWLWAIDSDLALPLPARIVMLALGAVPTAGLVVFYAHSLGFSPPQLVWEAALLLAGHSVSWVAAVEFSAVLGCLFTAVVLVVSAARRPEPVAPPVTVRGPVTYAGPGSLGGTKSALRR
jgi:hypothetical protein